MQIFNAFLSILGSNWDPLARLSPDFRPTFVLFWLKNQEISLSGACKGPRHHFGAILGHFGSIFCYFLTDCRPISLNRQQSAQRPSQFCPKFVLIWDQRVPLVFHARGRPPLQLKGRRCPRSVINSPYPCRVLGVC